jgi:hypothetical protein
LIQTFNDTVFNFLDGSFSTNNSLEKIKQLNLAACKNPENEVIAVGENITGLSRHQLQNDYSTQIGSYDFMEPKKSNDVEVNLLNISWIFNENSMNGENKFLNYFRVIFEARKNNRPLNYQFFDLEFIKTIHGFLYDFYFWQVIYFVFIPFMVYFTCTNVLFSQFILFEKDERALSKLYNITTILTIMGNVYFFLITLMQIIERPSLLLNKIAWAEFLSHGLNFLILYERVYLHKPLTENMHVLVAIAVWLMWVKLLQNLTIFTRFSYWYQLIIYTIVDIIDFFIIYGVIVAMFANAIYILNIPRVFPYVLDPELDLAPAVFDRDNHRFRYVAAIFKFYDISIGNADTEAYGEFHKDKAILHIFYMLSTFILTITIMNMLIGLMGNTLDFMNDNRPGVEREQQIELIFKHKFLFLVRRNALKKRYIITIKRNLQAGEEEGGDA